MDAVNHHTMGLPGTFELDTDYNVLGKKYAAAKFRGSFQGYLSWLKERPVAQPASRDHQDKFNEYLYGHGDDQWRGGPIDNLLSPHKDFGNYQAIIRKIQSDKLWKEVVFAFDKQMQRRRARDAYDGDYDHDKRWDAEPYQHRTKKPQVVRTVKITTEGAFSCGVGEGSINEFAAFVAAVVTLLEQNGVLVALDIAYTVTGIAGETQYKGNTVANMVWSVKRPDEYLPPSGILKCLSAGFYRRGVFASFVAAAEFLGGQVSGTLGQCIQYGKKWERKDNELFIYAIPSIDEQHKIAESLTQFIGLSATKT